MELYQVINEIKTINRNILLLDIDDTIVKAKNVFIYKEVDGKEVALTPAEFADEKIDDESKYDMRDFHTPTTVKKSIQSGEPIIHVLQYMDKHIHDGWVVGILTARGLEKTIFKTLRGWLQYRELTGKKRPIGRKLKEVFAVGDRLRYPGETSSLRKANVIKELSTQYNKVKFVDDDQKNIDAVNRLRLKNVETINAGEIV